MTASAPSGAMKHVAKRPSDAKQQIIGQMAVDPTHSDVMSNSLGKTATRSKAGCMTCRIRRKKCDLQRNNDSCQTCIRLRIGCLGWGAKRPEALRDPAVVKEIQRRIKVHLASNNMIKGSARSSAAATPGQQILFFHNTPNHPQFTQSPSHIVHPPFSSTPLHSWHSPSSSDHSSGPRDASPFPPVHSLTTTAPQPSSTPSSDVPGGAAGGAGASYGGQSFLSFADLVGANSSSHNEAQTPASGRKGKSRQSKHAPVEATDDLSEDGSGEDDPDMHQGDRGSDEAASSFSRHPPGYPQPNYDPPQYSRRYPYEMGTPSQPAPYHAHAPHPYAQSDLRTRSYDYDNERDIRVDDNLRKAEREREAYRPQVPNGNLPHPPYERNMNGYQPFPRNDLIHGPGTGVASAGRTLHGYGPYGHAGYRGPSPSNSLNSSFPPGPQPKTDPFYNGLRLPMMDPRNAAAPLPGPILSFPMSRSGGTSPTSEHFLQPMDRAANGSVYSDSGYRSPNPAPGRSPMGAGMSSSHDSMANAAAETSEEAADVDGEPIVQLNPTPNVATNTQTQQPNYAPNPFLPGGSSFGQSYSFDKTFRDAELEGNSTGALVSNPAVNNTLPMDSQAFSAMMMLLGIESSADASAAIEANANTADYTQIGALQQLRVGMAPPPPIDSQLMYVATFGNQFTSRQMELLHLYKNQLCNLQYHIAHSADASIADELFNLAMHSEAALFGTLTLTSLYKIRLRGSPEYRKYLEGRLLQFGALGQAVGNTVSCLRLMQAVWRKRDQQHTGSRIVDWIDMMNDLGWSLLLV
ncbi:hypothetical protein FRC01_001749 [Tulasnella sp. 417]|nr:hypothetical protein FRC01_001749 [Tulasnella sp. 417]